MIACMAIILNFLTSNLASSFCIPTDNVWLLSPVPALSLICFLLFDSAHVCAILPSEALVWACRASSDSVKYAVLRALSRLFVDSHVI